MRRTPGSSYRRSGGGLPTWLVFLLGVALVFGIFYVFQGVQTFMRTGGLGVEEATRQALIIASATEERATSAVRVLPTFPTPTPQPTCTDFRVNVPNAIVRETASPNGAVVTSFNQGTIVCVLWRDAGSEWYTIDRNPETRRRELAYMHETVIEPVNPTPTVLPTDPPPPTLAITITLPPTVTPLQSEGIVISTDTPQPPVGTRTSAPTATPFGTRYIVPSVTPVESTAAPTRTPTSTPTATQGRPLQSA